MHYGQEHAIVDKFVSKQTEGPPVKQNDYDALSQLAWNMKNCEISCGGTPSAAWTRCILSQKYLNASLTIYKISLWLSSVYN